MSTVCCLGTMTQSLQILYPPTDTEVVVGGTAVFQCIAVDKVVPTIEWKKTGHSSLAHPRVYTDENGRKLVISNAVVADEGTYKCEVSKSKTASAKLTILGNICLPKWHYLSVPSVSYIIEFCDCCLSFGMPFCLPTMHKR